MTKRSVAQARNSLSELIERALNGEEVVITRHGAPVVELKPVRPAGRPMTAEEIDRLAQGRVGRPMSDMDAGEFVSRMRDEDEERLFRR